MSDSLNNPLSINDLREDQTLKHFWTMWFPHNFNYFLGSHSTEHQEKTQLIGQGLSMSERWQPPHAPVSVGNQYNKRKE